MAKADKKKYAVHGQDATSENERPKYGVAFILEISPY